MRGIVLLALSATLSAQPPRFEVASVKRAAGEGLSGMTGGPGTNDPGRWACRRVALRDLLSFALRSRSYELNAPAWTASERFDIDAKVPAGATFADVREMVQMLLVERFDLQFHREQKEIPIYHLVVAKNGPKLTASQGPPSPPRRPVPPTMGKNGFPEIPPGQYGQSVMNGRAAWRAIDEPVERLAAYVSGFVGRPVRNATGLAGKYDFLLYWVNQGAPDADGPTIFAALNDQLGLKLEPARGSIDVVVVDRLSRTPAEN